MSENTTVQKIILKTEEYIASLKKANDAMKTTTDDTNKSLVSNSKQYAQNESQVKQWGKSVTDQLSAYGSKMKENLALGAKAITLDVGRDALKTAARDATAMAFSFSKAFAEIKSRSNASESDLAKWKKSLMTISTDTTANMDSMAESFKDMFSSVKNPEELLKIMDTVGKAAAMGDGDATKVSSMVKTTLQGQGREVNAANVNDVLGASDILRRHGNGFANMQDAMGAIGSISGQDMAKSKLSERDLAAILAGASKSGSSKEASVGAIGDLIKQSNNGLMEGSVLASILGSGKLTDKSGKFDINSLGKEGTYSKLLKLGGGDENKSREVFAKISGLSAESSDAIFNMVKNFKDLNAEVINSKNDTKAFADSAAESKDNLVNAYSGFKNSLITGVTDIFGGFEKPFKSLLQGNIGGAIGSTGGALKQSMSGISEHPALVAGAFATVLGGGALLGSVLKSVGGGALGTAAGVAKGKALQEAGVTPVFVVNASEIGGGSGGLGDASKLAGAGGFLGKLGMVGVAAGAGLAVGTGINAIADANGSKNKYGQDYNILEKGMAKVIPEWMGGMSSDEYKENYTEQAPQKVVVEIDMKDPGFMARPKAGDSQRDGRNY